MTPYRDGKPIADVIPPDRRRQRAIMMIAGGMIVGALLIEGVRLWLAPDEPAAVKVPDAPPPGVLPGPITQEEVSAVVARNKADLRNRCFRPELGSATVQLEIVVGKDGSVVQSHYEGSDARVTECVDREVRQWRFPAHSEDSAKARIPFVFERT